VWQQLEANGVQPSEATQIYSKPLTTSNGWSPDYGISSAPSFFFGDPPGSLPLVLLRAPIPTMAEG
jgi:hypothetical protein